MSIPIYITSNTDKDYELLSEGLHSAVVADVNVVEEDTPWGRKQKVKLLWLTDEADSTGHTKYAFNSYGASIFAGNGKTGPAKLYTFIKTVTGKEPKLTDGASGPYFEAEDLLGMQAQLIIQHKESQRNGKVYANVIGVMKPKEKVAIPPDFQRKKDRNATSSKVGGGTAAARAVLAPPTKASVTNDDIPF